MVRPPVVTLASRLAAALEAVARALSTPDNSALMAAEQGLAAALADLGHVTTVASNERAAIAAELTRARAALARCRILGSSAADVVQAALAAQGRSGGYNHRAVMPVGPGLRGTGMKGRL